MIPVAVGTWNSQNNKDRELNDGCQGIGKLLFNSEQYTE